MKGILGFVFIVLGAISMSSAFGPRGLVIFLLIMAAGFILWRAHLLWRTRV